MQELSISSNDSSTTMPLLLLELSAPESNTSYFNKSFFVCLRKKKKKHKRKKWGYFQDKVIADEKNENQNGLLRMKNSNRSSEKFNTKRVSLRKN